MLEELKEAVYEANMELQRRGLVLYTFGNASGICRNSNLVVIKPSGVVYEQMRPSDMVVVDLDHKIVEGELRPSSDTKTHLALYRAWPDIGGVVHTHSCHATAWCQAGRALPCYGTTHADYAYGSVPCTAVLRDELVAGDYEANTGVQILEAFADRDHQAVPMVLLAGHAPFTWGRDAAQAAYHAAILEELACMATLTEQLNPGAEALKQSIVDKHYFRKHGAAAYYGQ
ncbi:MAG: L-ribulose-5-phosphate 4-epimerase AraD [Planctomycetota bacterium]